MRTPFKFHLPLLATVLAASLSACGGGGTSAGVGAPMSSPTGTAGPTTTLAETTTGSSAATSTVCAQEGGTCNVSGTAQVRYGTATASVVKTVTGPVVCSNEVFGDPAPGYAKSCSIELPATSVSTAMSSGASAAMAAGSTCANENGTCNVNGTVQVRYGTATASVVKTVTGPVACSNSVFGDPAPGYAKTCTIDGPTSAPATPAAPVPASWTACATEGGTCNVSGTVQVRYGTASASVVKTVTGPVACSNAVFGDPMPGYAKTCSVGAPGTAPVVTLPGTTAPAPTPAPAPAPSTPVPAPVAVAGAITTVQLTNTAASSQTGAATTFGQVFAAGDLPNGASLTGKTASGVAVPLQVDVKARHPDGSVRHAVITAQLPSIGANATETVGLLKGTASAAAAATTPAALLNSGFSAVFSATIGGVQYSASADALLKSGKYTTWLSGPLVNEWLISAPLKTAAGVEHPHLTAQFAIRSYAGSNSARVDVTIENGWAFEAAPQNFTYDALMQVGGQTVYSQAALTHYHHARWRKLFWWGKAQTLNVRHNTAYLIASKAVPNYDQSLVITNATIASWQNQWTASKPGPMKNGVAAAYMPTTGSRSEIGPMPSWSAMYLLSMDQRMKDVTLGMSEAAGSWSSHYRSKNTGRPVTLAEYPYMSVITSSNDTRNPATKQLEAFPDCPATLCTTPMTADASHQAAFSYLPYLVTGDYYHLEELQFWANFDSFYGNPAYRQYAKGLVKADQVRGQAWSLRTLAEAAYITPDNDPQKAQFISIVNNNIDWYTANYANNPAANKLGILDHDGAVAYDGGLGMAPWMDDFFTAMLGHAVELGFSNGQAMLAYKSRFVVDRFVGAGFCWIEAGLYSMKVRPSANAADYATMAEVWNANVSTPVAQLQCGSQAMASVLKLRVGEMEGDFGTEGMQAILQPALAYATGANAAKAWAVFAARPYKPDYASEPQYAIVPR